MKRRWGLETFWAGESSAPTMRFFLIGACISLSVSGCSAGGASPLASAPLRKIAREAAGASLNAGREALARSCSRAKQSLPQDFAWQGWSAGLVESLKHQTTLHEIVRAEARQVRELSKKLKAAHPAVTRAVSTTVRLELKMAMNVVCTMPISPC